MATVSDLKLTIVPGDSLDTIKVRVRTKIRFNEFDRNTQLNYRRSFTLLGVPPGGAPPVLTGRIGDPVPNQNEIDIVTALVTLVPADNSVDAADPRVVDDAVDLTDVFEIPRATADEDAGTADDELQIRCELEPNLPVTQTFLSNVVVAQLS